MSGATQPSCERTRGIRDLLLVLAPSTIAAAPLESFSRWVSSPWLLVAFISASLALAGVLHRDGRGRWRVLATAAFLLWSVGTLLQHVENPGRGMVVLVGVVGFVAFLWPSEVLRRYELEHSLSSEAQGILLACGVAGFFGLDAWQSRDQSTLVIALAMSVAYLIPVWLLSRQVWTSHLLFKRLVLSLATLAALWPAGFELLSVSFGVFEFVELGLFSPVLVVVLVLRREVAGWVLPQSGPSEPGLLDAILMHPSRVLVFSFMTISVIGAFLLALPVSARTEPISWLDAIFTAVSATCVTGLVVLDTPSAFSGFGLVAILFLFQVGGLGIMVFSAAAVGIFGRRMSLSHERAAVDLVGAEGRADLLGSIRVILLVTFITELVSAVLLFIGFWALGDGVGAAAWRGLFTAVSAFCNAGFALQSDSLIGYSQSAYILSVVGVTITIGSISPSIIAALFIWRRPERRTLHARIVLWSMAVLFFVPAILIAVLEWNRTMAELGIVDKTFNAAFQSVTRTAGFNSIDIAKAQPATWTLFLLVMLIGGSPGSTAGGIKVTTAAIILLTIFSVVRGRERVEIFGRTIPAAIVMRATAVLALGLIFCFLAIAAMQVTQSMPIFVAIFEAVSATATVGLSLGGTSALDEVGKVIVIVCMFTGRVGPLTLFMFLSSNQKVHSPTRYPEETLPIG